MSIRYTESCFFLISHSSLFLIPGVARHSCWHIGRCSEEHRHGAFALQKCGNFCFEQNFEPTSKTMPRWSNLISSVPECSVNHGQADMRTPLLIFELSDPAPDVFLGCRITWQRPHDELSSLAANKWLNSGYSQHANQKT
jgi:hypothetical protein